MNYYKNYIQIAVIAVIAIGLYVYYGAGMMNRNETATLAMTEEEIRESAVLPKDGIKLPIVWGNTGVLLTDLGVVDREKIVLLYEARGGLSAKELVLLSDYRGDVVMTRENAGYLLNLFWGFGLANKNSILEEGPMNDPQYGGTDRFASTAGWTLASGLAMDHFSAHGLVRLTTDEQAKVKRVSENIYRPCCGNSTYFPDCNHGMAMLGLLELMAANGVSEEEMYRVALQVNAFWFPDTYLTIARYFEKRGVLFADLDPKEILGKAYSSAQGYRKILQEVEPVTSSGGGGCGV